MIRKMDGFFMPIIFVCMFNGLCYGYDDQITHKKITEVSTMSSGSNAYLKQYILFSGGVNQIFLGKLVVDLLKDGSQLEDTPICRASNHFHNPLNFLPWTDSYMDDEPFYIHYACSGSGWGIKRSAVTWATGFTAPAPGGAKLANGNTWDWDAARGYFLQALTAQTQGARDNSYARTFQALGQVLHLLQDMAVPAHVRSDFQAHLSFIGFNGSLWPTAWFGNLYEDYVKRNDFLVGSRPAVFPDLASRTVTNHWDTNIYTSGCADNGPRLSGTNLGLAEYANANFLSLSTMFTENYDCRSQYAFPHPRLDETNNWRDFPLEYRLAEDGVTDLVHLLSIDDPEVAGGENPRRAIAAVRYLHTYYPGSDLDYYQREFFLNPDDDFVFRDTADRLLPRAVGYSASLLDYFFRGRFEPPDPASLVETLSPNILTVRFKNASGEAMTNGTLSLYQDSGDDGVPGMENPSRNLVTASVGSLADNQTYAGTEFSNVHVTVPQGRSIDNIIFTLVFTGKLGQENNAVVARRFNAPPPTLPPLPSKIDVGANPQGLAVTPDGKKLYVANMSSNTVSVIDLSTGAVTKTISVGNGPVDVAVTPDSRKAFVVNQLDRSVTVIDAVNDTILGTITGLRDKPQELAAAPEGGSVYITNYSFSPLGRLDFDEHGNYTLTAIGSPSYPLHGIAVDPLPSNPYLYLSYYASWWDYAVAKVDRGTGNPLVTKIPGYCYNWGAALAGRKLYVARPGMVFPQQTYQVNVFDVDAEIWLTSVTLGRGPRGVASSPDNAFVYVANLYDDTVSVIKTAGNTVIDPPYPAGDGPADVAVSPDGKLLFVSNSFEGKVSVIRTDVPPAGAGAFSLMGAASSEEASWGSALLLGFPPGGLVTVDREFPRFEEWTAEGLKVFFPAGTRTLSLSWPDVPDRAIELTAGAGETIMIDGRILQ
jgi:YVTN family beta-propeller protein